MYQRRTTQIKSPRKTLRPSNLNNFYITSTSNSPYHEDAIMPMPPPSPPLIRSPRTRAYNTQPIIIPNSIYSNRYVPKYASTQRKGLTDYQSRTKLKSKLDRDFDDYMKSQSFQVEQNTPYHYDHLSEYQLSLRRTKKMLADTQKEEKENQKHINQETQNAIQESYQHDLYHNDHIYSSRNKSLRIIPVTNRFNSDIPMDQMPYV